MKDRTQINQFSGLSLAFFAAKFMNVCMFALGCLWLLSTPNLAKAADQAKDLGDCIELKPTNAFEILQRAETWAKNLTTFQAHFSQESSAAALGAHEQSGGIVVFANPGKMRWSYEWPEKQDFVIEGDTMRLYQPSLKQLLIDSAQAVLSSDLPVAFLSGIATVTEKFSLLRGCKVTDNLTRVELKPKQKGAVSELHLVVTNGSGLVVGATVIDESENITSFTFSKIKEHQPLAATQFVMTVPEGTDIQDNRQKKAA